MSALPDGARVLTINSKPHGPDEVLIVFEDSGPGIDPKNIDRIFDAFFTTKSQGMGMGLSICRSIIEAHNGRLWVSSSSGHGSVFNILLPAINVSIHVVTTTPDVKSIVFVVDDDASVREAVQRLFQSVGLHAEAFASAAEFLLRKPPEVPCCLVLDVRLKELSGLDFQLNWPTRISRFQLFS